MGNGNTNLGEGINRTEMEAGREAAGNRIALVRGRLLVSLGIALLTIFGVITASVLLLNALVLDIPITHEVTVS